MKPFLFLKLVYRGWRLRRRAGQFWWFRRYSPTLVWWSGTLQQAANAEAWYRKTRNYDA